MRYLPVIQMRGDISALPNCENAIWKWVEMDVNSADSKQFWKWMFERFLSALLENNFMIIVTNCALWLGKKCKNIPCKVKRSPYIKLFKIIYITVVWL